MSQNKKDDLATCYRVKKKYLQNLSRPRSSPDLLKEKNVKENKMQKLREDRKFVMLLGSLILPILAISAPLLVQII